MEELNEQLHLQILNFNREKRARWMRERKPYAVLFELTARCNFDCIHCYLQHCHISEQLTYEQVISIIDILYEKGILFLTLTGGEILLRPDFLDIYLYAKNKGFLVELFTNGYLFDDRIIAALQKYPPLLVDISLYGGCEETYRKVTGIPGAFDRVVANCRKLKRAGIRFSLKSPIIKPTLPELERMQAIAEEIGVPFVYTFEITSTIDRDTAPKELQVELPTVLADEFASYYRQRENGTWGQDGDTNAAKERLRQNDCVYSCNVALNSFVIDYLGRMCPCMKLRHRGVDLLAGDFDQIWADFGRFSRIKASPAYKCNQCDAHYYCDVCPAEADLMYGDMEYRPESCCRIAQLRRDFYEGHKTYEETLRAAEES